MKRRNAARMWRDVTESLRSQPGRVGLSFFAVMVGIVVLTLLLSMLLGLRDQSRLLIRQFGANVAAIIPDANFFSDRGYRGLHHLSNLIEQNVPATSAAAMVRVGETIDAWERTPVWACALPLPALRGWSILNGRGFDVHDEQVAARVALVNDVMARKFGIRPGHECSIGPHAFRVIGILSDGAGIPSASGPSVSSGEMMVLIPLVTAERLGLPLQMANAAIFTQTGDDQPIDVMVQRTRRLLADPQLAGWGDQWITPDSLIRGIRDLQRIITLTAGSIALLCLMLGGTTLMSLMLADVRQRIPEIGLRRALGATRREVALLFVVESCVITGAAAIGGIAVGAALLSLLTGRIAIPLSMSLFTFVIPVIVSIVLGGMFSYWPARVASALSPAQALRNA